MFIENTVQNIVAAFRGMHVSQLNIAMRDYQESATTEQTHTDRQKDRQMPDKVIPMCHYASQATQQICRGLEFF